MSLYLRHLVATFGQGVDANGYRLLSVPDTVQLLRLGIMHLQPGSGYTGCPYIYLRHLVATFGQGVDANGQRLVSVPDTVQVLRFACMHCMARRAFPRTAVSAQGDFDIWQEAS